ncbi:MAG: bifunctional glutamate N-acetyltransferase/amino-acid acetyltransferase ArgJ [Lachnospira sp.]|nr:bifunctional glutamate N-acetyltransferase/amino-acid acetyltransferase ArgJ [Lachnospira sp.]
MEIIQGGVTAATGFSAAGLNAGIKNNVKKDMAMVFSKAPCVTAGTFTTNKVSAAPVKWDKNVVYNSEYAQAVVINSGVANACTGEEGYQACDTEAAAVAENMGIPKESVLVASTGVIGKQLPMDIIVKGINELPGKLADTLEAGTEAAEAIMTTDTRSKQVACTVEIGDKKVTVGGMCKGAGMIHPNMATMLCFITSDVSIDKACLQKMTSEIVDDSFNMISVDGDTSTNDTVLVLANGLAGNDTITCDSDDYDTFYEALSYVLTELSKMIAGDGEGCTCLFEAQVINASSKAQARTLAKAIITSSLTKAAIFGHDANWGRILCAMGYSGADFDPEKVDIYFESEAGKLKIVEDGKATDYSEEKATEILSKNPVVAIADVKEGDVKATAWGCDLTFDYVKINADYRS